MQWLKNQALCTQVVAIIAMAYKMLICVSCLRHPDVLLLFFIIFVKEIFQLIQENGSKIWTGTLQ